MFGAETGIPVLGMAGDDGTGGASDDGGVGAGACVSSETSGLTGRVPPPPDLSTGRGWY